jgi:MFS family permease
VNGAGPPDESTATGLRAIPRGVWALGLVSLCMDTSSELIHSLLPMFLVTVLGASVVSVGLIEGIAEATAQILKVFSGALSDYLGRRKLLTVIGYGVAALTKPLFPLAGSTALVFTARVVDRIGKGIRGAPRDALIADISPPEIRGASFGLRQSLDTVGAFLGPLLAIICMALLADDVRAVFWIATLPAVAAVIILIVGVREPRTHAAAGEAPTRPRLRLADSKRFGAGFWWLVLFAAVLAVGRFSEAFLLLRAQDVGLGLTYLPVVLMLMNVTYAASSYPAGALSDRVDRVGVIGIGCLLLIAADVVLASAHGVWVVLAGAALWGLHLGLTQGLLSAIVADHAPARFRGTAFGIFNLVTGLGVLLASVIAGVLWEQMGPPATFLAGAGLTAIAVLGLGIALRRRDASARS